MDEHRSPNLLGALALALTDRLADSTAITAAHGASAPAALVAVGNHPNETIDRLSRTLGLSHSATVRVVDRLQADGLIVRGAGPGGRAVALRLSPAGERRMRSILDERRRILSPLFAELEPDERAVLTSLVERLLAGLPHNEGEARRICRLCDESVCRGSAVGCPVERAVAVR